MYIILKKVWKSYSKCTTWHFSSGTQFYLLLCHLLVLLATRQYGVLFGYSISVLLGIRFPLAALAESGLASSEINCLDTYLDYSSNSGAIFKMRQSFTRIHQSNFNPISLSFHKEAWLYFLYSTKQYVMNRKSLLILIKEMNPSIAMYRTTPWSYHHITMQLIPSVCLACVCVCIKKLLHGSGSWNWLQNKF